MKKILTLIIFPIFIFVANLILVWPLFQGEYTRQIGSIESVFIADARFIFENFPHLSWNSYWYAGFPFHLFYTPLLPYLMALTHFLYPPISIASWYRIFIGIFYAATPVSLYFFVRFLTGRSGSALLSALIFSFAPSLGYLMPQVGGMGQEYGNAPWRILTLILFGEGGHIAGLFFLPLALLFFIKAVRDATWRNVFLAAFFTGLLALTNIIALIGFAVMFLIVLFTELLSGNWPRKLWRSLMIGVFSFGLVAFWYNLSFIKASLSIGTGGVGGTVGESYLHFLPLVFLSAPVIFILALLVGKRKSLEPVFISLGWIAIFYVAAYLWFKNETMILPQPNRYFPEMDMGVAILISWFSYLLIEKIIPQKLDLIRKITYIVVIIFILYLPFRYITQIWGLTAPHKDITQTSEYRIASWLKNNTSGERIFATGTSAFWLNTFTNIPQVRGGNDGVANPWMLHATYQINTGENAPKGKEGEVAIDWLRALNASHIVVNLPSSGEIYHDFTDPGKFTQVEGVSEQVNLKGDVIYKIPLIHPGLAQTVSEVDFTNLMSLKNAVDFKNLQKYVDYIDGQTVGDADFSWVGVGRAKIKANLTSGEAIGVQVNYNSGWKAYLGDKQIPIKNDVIGFMFLDPQTTGEVEIDLVYGRTWDVWLGYFLTILAIGGLIFYPRLAPKSKGVLPNSQKQQDETEEND